MKKLIIVPVCGLIILFASCSSSTESLYTWYDYENSAYQYQKKYSDESYVDAMEEYLKVIEKQKGARKVVPPGLNAEYGYMLYKNGKIQEGLKFFKQEIALYPESEVYISRIIKQLEE